MDLPARDPAARTFWGFSRYQWLVLFAAWLGWGFDAFDALLFNFVAPVCVPLLRGAAPSDPGAAGAAAFWIGALTSLLLVGWAIGGILFGRLTDLLGRTRTLLLTMITYALGTAACAFAPNLFVLALFRFIASLGIGGEWAAGASLVAETVPEDKRVVAGALLYTSAPLGIALAGGVSDFFLRSFSPTAHDAHLAWRVTFLTGLVPALLALLLRRRLREPERWTRLAERPRLRALWSGSMARRTVGGLSMAVIALVTWWTCNAFLPLVARALARAPGAGASFAASLTTVFNVGGVVGTVLTIPLAVFWGRRPMFAAFFAGSALFLWLGFAAQVPPPLRLVLLGCVGLCVFGVLASFSFYLPELFPTALRGTGAGFCYNTGRVLTAAGPLLLGQLARRGDDPLVLVRAVAIVPLLGLVLLACGIAVETRGDRLAP